MKALLGLTSAVLMAGTCFFAANATAPYAAASPVLMQERDWYAPPAELDEVARHGFHDGIEGARKDFGNHRRPDVNNRDEYRHPHVPERDREAYRRGFERGYRVGVDHLYNGRL